MTDHNAVLEEPAVCQEIIKHVKSVALVYYFNAQVYQSLCNRLEFLMYLRQRLDYSLLEWMHEAKGIDNLMARDAYRKLHNQRVSFLTDHIELARFYRSRLDVDNTIQATPAGRDARDWLTRWTRERICARVGLDPVGSKPDFWSVRLMRGTYKKRRHEYIQRIQFECARCAADGWFMVFDTLTLSEDGKSKIKRNTFTDYALHWKRQIKRKLGLSRDDKTEVLRYICVPEYGSANGRLHWHVLWMMKALPYNAVDPNLGRMVHDYREISVMKKWKYGFNTPIAVRYTDDAFTRAGWHWPVDKKGEPLEPKDSGAVGFYVSKYINKMEESEWKKKTTKRFYRIKMSKRFGLPETDHLATDQLLQILQMHWSVSEKSDVWKKSAKKSLSLRLANLDLKTFLELRPETMPLLDLLRALTSPTPSRTALNFIGTRTPKLRNMDISDDVLDVVREANGNFVAVAAK